MKLNLLGNTNLTISPLCFGTLTVSPIHKNFSPRQAAVLFENAYELGVNFFDTAELYGTYDALGLALKTYPEMVIASKSYAVTYTEMSQSLEKARMALNRDYIDIFCLHELENSTSFQGHQGALECLYDAKAKGMIKAIGISTHTVAGVRAGATNPGVDVIHPLINRAGIGIKDGTAAAMIEAMDTAKEFGKGIYAMKALAGGHLSQDAAAAVRFVTELASVDSIAIGMQSIAEVKLNLALILGEVIEAGLQQEVTRINRCLQIAQWCQGCGRCVERCNFGALELNGGKAHVDPKKCVRCGYCATVCPEFCLKVI